MSGITVHFKNENEDTLDIKNMLQVPSVGDLVQIYISSQRLEICGKVIRKLWHYSANTVNVYIVSN